MVAFICLMLLSFVIGIVVGAYIYQKRDLKWEDEFDKLHVEYTKLAHELHTTNKQLDATIKGRNNYVADKTDAYKRMYGAARNELNAIRKILNGEYDVSSTGISIPDRSSDVGEIKGRVLPEVFSS